MLKIMLISMFDSLYISYIYIYPIYVSYIYIYIIVIEVYVLYNWRNVLFTKIKKGYGYNPGQNISDKL